MQTTKKPVKNGVPRKVAKSPTQSSRPAKPVGQPIDKDRSYTTEQLCESAAISRATLCRWKRAGLHCSVVAGRNRYLGADVIAFLHGGK